MEQRLNAYFSTLHETARGVVITDGNGKPISQEAGYAQAMRQMRATHEAGNKLMFIGNGGSAGIASHMAIDYSKSGGIRAMAFNDGAALTCLGNDLGYENVFAKQIELHARSGDLLVAISSSGQSLSILKAADAARERGCTVYTFSGFSVDNPLRSYGELNFYVDSSEYGFVEISHLALIHSILDLEMGWGKTEETTTKSAMTKSTADKVAKLALRA